MHIINLLKVLIWLCVVSVASYGCSEPPPNNDSNTKRAHLVETVVVKKGMLSHSGTHTGTLRASRTTKIFNREEGQINNLPFYEGDTVSKGRVLVELDNQLLKAELAKATATRRQAELDLNRRKTGINNNQLFSKEEKARAKTALDVARSEEKILETRLSFTKIKAPFSGVVSERLVEIGDIAPRHTHLLSLYDPGSLLTEISVSELILPFIKLGDRVEVRIDALGDNAFSGSIKRIHPSLNEITRRSIVEVDIKPVPPGAMIGQFCRVVLTTQAKERLVIPFNALQRDRKGEYVYLFEDGKVEKVSVRSGLRLADKIEIVEGLVDGDNIVVKGFLGLRQGKEVKNVISADASENVSPEFSLDPQDHMQRAIKKDDK